MARVSILIVVGLSLAACRGELSALPPVHLNQNMDHQRVFEAQEANDFFADGRGMRPQVEGTVARGELRADEHFYQGKVGGLVADRLPQQLKVTRSLLERGRARYDIYCAPCHDRAGTGNGLVMRHGVKFGMVAPPDFNDRRVRAMPVGTIYDAIKNGARDMPAYGSQIPVTDRWAIVAYVRVLQAARSAPIDQVPGEIAEQKGWSGDAAEAAADDKAAGAKTPAPAGAKAPAADKAAAKPAPAAAKDKGAK